MSESFGCNQCLTVVTGQDAVNPLEINGMDEKGEWQAFICRPCLSANVPFAEGDNLRESFRTRQNTNMAEVAASMNALG